MIPKVKFVYDRRKTAGPGRPGSVEVEINYAGKQKFFATGILLLPSEWNKSGRCAKGRHAVETNEDLDLIYNKVKSILKQMVEDGSVDLNVVPKLLKNKIENKTFWQFIEERIQDRTVGDTTKEKYVCWLNTFKTYGKIKYFSDISVAAVLEFDAWLHRQTREALDENGNAIDVKKYCQGTIKNYHKNLRVFIGDAKTFKYVKENPYESGDIHIDRGDKDHVDYISEEQLHKIEETHYVGYMQHAKDLFLLQCYTGMSYGDVISIDRSFAKETSYGLVYTDHRIKNNNRYTFLILPEAKAILDKYNWNMPHINNPKYNVYLKAIGQVIGEPKLHSHQGRGAFATIALNRGMDMAVLQRILGHKKIQTTQHYATMLDDTVVKQMAEKLK